MKSVFVVNNWFIMRMMKLWFHCLSIGIWTKRTSISSWHSRESLTPKIKMHQQTSTVWLRLSSKIQALIFTLINCKQALTIWGSWKLIKLWKSERLKERSGQTEPFSTKSKEECSKSIKVHQCSSLWVNLSKKRDKRKILEKYPSPLTFHKSSKKLSIKIRLECTW